MNNVRQIVIMINVYFFVYKVESQIESQVLQLSLSAEPEEFEYITNVTFKCISSIVPTDCSADFLYNSISIDSLKSANGSCYHTHGLCNTKKCTCHEDCKRFSLTVTDTNYTTGDIVSCKVLFIFNRVIRSMTTGIIYNRKKFSELNTSFGVVAKPDGGSNTDIIISHKGEAREQDYIVITAISTCAVMIFSLFTCLIFKLSKTGILRARNPSHESIRNINRRINRRNLFPSNADEGPGTDSDINIHQYSQRRDSTVNQSRTDTGKDSDECLAPRPESSGFDIIATETDTELYSDGCLAPRPESSGFDIIATETDTELSSDGCLVPIQVSSGFKATETGTDTELDTYKSLIQTKQEKVIFMTDTGADTCRSLNQTRQTKAFFFTDTEKDYEGCVVPVGSGFIATGLGTNTVLDTNKSLNQTKEEAVIFMTDTGTGDAVINGDSAQLELSLQKAREENKHLMESNNKLQHEKECLLLEISKLQTDRLDKNQKHRL